MPTRVEIQCINKSDRQNPHERISFVGGIHNGERWKMSEDKAIQDIQNGTYTFWTKGGGKTADVVIATHLGRKYLKTTRDGIKPDNLLELLECP